MDTGFTNYLKDPLILALFLSFLVEFFTSRTFDFTLPFILKRSDSKNKDVVNKHDYESVFKKKYGPYVSFFWGEVFAFLFKLKFFHSLSLMQNEKLLILDIILSGIIISKGSNFLYDLRKMFKK